MRNAKRLAIFALLVMSWLFLLYTLTLFTALIMAPWAAAVDLPAVGTWQRTLNDFFENSVGQLTLSVPVVLLSVGITITTLRSRPELLSRAVISNVLFSFGAWALIMAATIINNQIFPYPPVLYDPNYRGFHRSVLPMATLLAACVAWIIAQRRARLPFPSFRLR